MLRRNPVSLLEVPREVAGIEHSHLPHDLLDAQVRVFQKTAGSLEAQLSLILAKRDARFIFEEMVKT